MGDFLQELVRQSPVLVIFSGFALMVFSKVEKMADRYLENMAIFQTNVTDEMKNNRACILENTEVLGGVKQVLGRMNGSRP